MTNMTWTLRHAPTVPPHAHPAWTLGVVCPQVFRTPECDSAHRFTSGQKANMPDAAISDTRSQRILPLCCLRFVSLVHSTQNQAPTLAFQPSRVGTAFRPL